MGSVKRGYLGLFKILEEQNNTHEVYSKKVLSNKTKNKILSYQEKHIVKLICILLSMFVALDASDTGIGKTFIAIAICKEIKKIPYIVCPKSLIYNWISVLEYMDIDEYEIVNYETLRGCKSYKTDTYKTRMDCPYLKFVDHEIDENNPYNYSWDLPKNAILIFDEAHRCKDPSTDNGKLLLSTKQLIDNKIPVLLLSATISEKYLEMKIPLVLFGKIGNTRGIKQYIESIKENYPEHHVNQRQFSSFKLYKEAVDKANAMILNIEIKDYCSRIRIKDLGDKFPSNQVCCQQFIAEGADKIAQNYEEINRILQELREKPAGHHLADLQKLKQENELAKVPIFVEQAKLYLEEGKSVVIFVNFLSSLNEISRELQTRCCIHGKQTREEKHECITRFQDNKEYVIVCQARAGSVGISLHDIHGTRPRVSLINFPDSGTDLIQELGRIHRANGKSPCLQRILFVAGVEYEKNIMRQISRKLANISAINDGDLDGYKYKVKEITRRRISEMLDRVEKGDNIDEIIKGDEISDDDIIKEDENSLIKKSKKKHHHKKHHKKHHKNKYGSKTSKKNKKKQYKKYKKIVIVE